MGVSVIGVLLTGVSSTGSDAIGVAEIKLDTVLVPTEFTADTLNWYNTLFSRPLIIDMVSDAVPSSYTFHVLSVSDLYSIT